jgi:hypothetical protein
MKHERMNLDMSTCMHFCIHSTVRIIPRFSTELVYGIRTSTECYYQGPVAEYEYHGFRRTN